MLISYVIGLISYVIGLISYVIELISCIIAVFSYIIGLGTISWFSGTLELPAVYWVFQIRP